MILLLTNETNTSTPALQNNLEVSLTLLQLVALALPAIAIIMQVWSQMETQQGTFTGTPSEDLAYSLAKWSFLLFLVSAVSIISFLLISELDIVLKFLSIPLLMALIVFIFGIWSLESMGFLETLREFFES